jgi:hypothetical protein
MAFLPLLVLLSCGSAKTDANAVPGFLTATIDGRPVKATVECLGAISSEAPDKLQLHFIFKDAAAGTDLFSVVVFHFKERPAKISEADLLALAPDSLLPSHNALTITDSLMYFKSKMDFEINRFERIDANHAKIGGRLSGRIFYDMEKPAGKQPYIEIREGVFTDIELTIM